MVVGVCAVCACVGEVACACACVPFVETPILAFSAADFACRFADNTSASSCAAVDVAVVDVVIVLERGKGRGLALAE